MVFKSISLHCLAIFRQTLMTVLPFYLFKATPVMRLTSFLASFLGSVGVHMLNIAFPKGILWNRLCTVCETS